MATPTACILCSLNCGLSVELADGHITSVRGDEDHPISQGYLCQKATRIDFYQHGRSRLTSPLRRRDDGTFEEVSWDTAVTGIARELKRIRDDHGGHALAYYGGGGQGNHLNGAYASSLRAGMRTRYIYNALAQEKTGGFWIDGQLFGKQTCHPAEDVEHSDYVLFLGTNPWQSHGFPQARKVLRAIAKDPDRTMVVVDPRRTETAAKADVFLQVRPGGDAWLMLALLGTLVQEDLVDHAFLEARTTGLGELGALFADVPVDDYARRAGVDPEAVRDVARGLAAAKRGCVRSDLGLEHSPNSTLNVYLAKLLFLVTGSFGKRGSNNLHTALAPLIGHSRSPAEGGRETRVTGMRELARLYPPNILPAEIDTDHPERLRGLVVDSANPLITAADTPAYTEALGKLELLVVVDVAMTETARLAHWVLPASSQLEKWEATFFNLEFPTNFFHLRRPLFEPTPGTLSEPEIYRRILVAMGELPSSFPLLERVARLDRRFPRLRLFPLALGATLKLKGELKRHAALVLHETLGKALPDGASPAAVVWFAAQQYARTHPAAVRRAGIEDQGAGLGEALFARIMESPSGTLISVHEQADMWSLIEHDDGRVHLVVPEMVTALQDLQATDEAALGEWPFVLMAGERRAYNANTIIRDESWRKNDPTGALKMCPDDAESLGLSDGARAVCTSSRGEIEVSVTVTDELQRGVVSLPHGFGLDEADGDGDLVRSGPRINDLTDAAWCDALSAVPFHKHVRVRIRPSAR